MGVREHDRAVWEGIFRDADPAWLSAPPSALMQRAADHFARAGSRSLLDVGSGFGRWSVFLARTVGCRVTGLDSAIGGARLARRLRGDSALPAAFLAGEAIALPFATGSFDAILAVLLLDNLERPDAAAAVAELDRVARPGASLFAVFNPLERPENASGNNPTAGCHNESYTRKEVVALLHGWRISGEFEDEHSLRAFEAIRHPPSFSR
ncbi:MAG TPA: class I SAM-dependent methyltransferase [Thermoanaerobaculia bacterium]|nr:class I SAM-dependent methyltransferase [Thermoanaerobaculia bacterium]